MTTITEDYVSFENAKLLKDKWFDQNCATYYLDGHVWRHYHSEVIPKGKQIYAAPTQAVVMKWLREEKNILIYVYPVIDLQVENNYTFYWRWNGKKKRHDASHIGNKHNYESFEQAVEAAIKYCLEHLI